MKKVIIKAEGSYTGEQVIKMFEDVLQNERDEVKANNIINNVYSLDDIYNHKGVIETRNIMGCEYKLKELIPAVELIGFDAVNEIVISKRKVPTASEPSDE